MEAGQATRDRACGELHHLILGSRIDDLSDNVDRILLALCLWGALQRGTALVLKGNRVEGEVFAFDALRCDNSHALARYSGRQFCDRGRIKTDNGIPTKVPAGSSVFCSWNKKFTSRGLSARRSGPR